MATSRAPSVHLSVHLSICREEHHVSPSPPPPRAGSPASAPQTRRNTSPRPDDYLRNRFLSPPCALCCGLHNFFSFVLGSVSALERFFSWKPWTEVSFKIAPRDQTDAGPSLVVLASKVKSAGSEGLGQSRPDQQEIKVFPAPLLPNLFLLPFPFAVGSFFPLSTSPIPRCPWT